MKKKLLTILAMACIGAALLSGCGGGTSAPEAPAVEDIVLPEDGSLPPVEEDLQKLYVGAQDIYTKISLANFECNNEDTFEKDGFEYYRVTEFESYDAFRAYLLQFFTETFVDGTILHEGNIMFAKGDNGGLYLLPAGRGTNIFYAGHTFAMDKEAETEMGFKATAYYTVDAPYEGEFFYEAPADPENYSTQEYLFVLWNVDGAWRFNTFYLFY